jgi:hypothetical protein
MSARHVTLRVQSPAPFGEVTIVPSPISGRPDGTMAEAMTTALAAVDAPTASEILKTLRQSFPQTPLSARVAALRVVMKRVRRRL